jgi:hypothetical protein
MTKKTYGKTTLRRRGGRPVAPAVGIEAELRAVTL